MEFEYTGIDSKAQRTKGKLKANNQQAVVEYLRSNNITPLTIRPVTKSGDFLFFKKVKETDLILFTRQLSSMIITGLTLLESLKVLRQQSLSTGMQEVVSDLIAQISEGSSFSDALESHREVFSDVYIALIRASEKGGLLDKVLARLADNLERADDLKKKVRSALFYPSIVITGMLVVIIVMDVFVIPQLGSLYESLHVELPLTTRIVLDSSRFATNFFPVIIILIILAIFLFMRFKKTEDGIKIIDKTKLNLPIVGGIIRMSILDEVARTLSILISSGTSIIESLNITANVAGNYWYKTAIQTSSQQVEKGVPLSDALFNQNIFPPMLVQMAKVGESTGKIDESLLKVAEYYERDLDVRIKTLTTAIEPILIVFLGISVAFLTLSIITPIYGLISQIQ